VIEEFVKSWIILQFPSIMNQLSKWILLVRSIQVLGMPLRNWLGTAEGETGLLAHLFPLSGAEESEASPIRRSKRENPSYAKS